MFQDRFPNDLKILCDSFNVAISSANKAWLAGTTLSLVAIGTSTGDVQNSWPGFNFTGYNFFAALSLALAAACFRLCVTHINMYQTQLVLHKYLRDTDAENQEFSESLTVKEVSHRLSIGAYNRFFPVLFALPDNHRENIMNKIKPIFEFFFILVPHIGMLAAIIRCVNEIPAGEKQIGMMLIVSTSILLVFLQILVLSISLPHILAARNRLVKETMQ